MQGQNVICSIIDEIMLSLKEGYLSEIQVSVVFDRLNLNLTYSQLLKKYNISCNKALVHCLLRTSMLEYWIPGMQGEGVSYLSLYDQDTFLKIIITAAEDKNCIPGIYSISLSHYLKKNRCSRAHILLDRIGCNDLANHCVDPPPHSKIWINNFVKGKGIHLASSQ